MEFNKVNKVHIIQGIKDFEEKGLPNGFGASSTYDLVFEDKKYPPKAIMAYANFHAEGKTIEPYFKGGLNTDCFKVFEKLQFNVIKKQLTYPIFQIKVSKTDKTSDGNFLTAQLQIVKGGYQLLKGSYIYKEPKKSILTHHYANLRGDVEAENEGCFENSNYDNYLILKKNITFETPTPAAVLVFNRPANGKTDWKLHDGTTLEEFENNQVKPLKQVNYWIFQGSPNIYNITAALKAVHLKSWKVAAHKDKIAVGDKVIIWQTGKNAGCYALAEVTSDVSIFEEETFEQQYYVKTSNSLATDRVQIKITTNLAEAPILWKDIKSTDIFNNFKAGNQGTNFSATKYEYTELTNLIDDRNQIGNTKLSSLIVNYKRALLEDNWLHAELYKFEWANWLNERIDFEAQTDEKILELCLSSQNENYTDSKGVQFIKQGAREKLSKYIGIEDIKIFRDFYDGDGLELENIDYSNRNMSFPILSCWMSVLVPNSIFPASRTSFSDIIKDLLSIKLKSSTIHFVIGMQKPMQEICTVLLEDKEVVDFVSQKLHKPELSQLDLNWLTQDFLLFIDRHPNLLESITETTEEKKEQKIMLNITPTNQILYGPPGTGKTYNTITEAVAIIQNKTYDEVKNSDRETVKKDFDVLSKKRQIMFTTFHQSMSYEDFVEGIKPVLIDDVAKDNQDVSYEILGGIFKQAAARAAYNSYKEFHVESNSGYTYSQLYESFIEMAREKIAKKTFFTCETKTGSSVEIFRVNKNDSIHARAEGSHVTHVAPLTKENIQKLYDTYKSVDEINHLQEVKNVVGVSPRTTEFYAVFKALLNFEKSDFEPNIENEELKEIDLTDEEILLQFDSGVFTEMSRKFGKESSKVVLVIDEINRGNVSAIFGELITLLEEDKRLGEANELVITLPYSKGQFSVPSNLFIVGTMNTADRSVEALDTALRRRFEFKEMMPDYTVIEKEEVKGLKLSEVLKTINERIELLIDRDHTIGHSYFFNVNSEEELANAFNNKIVPLLQEYFYGDYGKIGLVLGKGFVEKQKNDKVNFADFTYENANDFKTPSFLLKKVGKENIIEAVSIVLGKKQAE